MISVKRCWYKVAQIFPNQTKSSHSSSYIKIVFSKVFENLVRTFVCKNFKKVLSRPKVCQVLGSNYRYFNTNLDTKFNDLRISQMRYQVENMFPTSIKLWWCNKLDARCYFANNIHSLKSLNIAFLCLCFCFCELWQHDKRKDSNELILYFESDMFI